MLFSYFCCFLPKLVPITLHQTFTNLQLTFLFVRFKWTAITFAAVGPVVQGYAAAVAAAFVVDEPVVVTYLKAKSS